MPIVTSPSSPLNNGANKKVNKKPVVGTIEQIKQQNKNKQQQQQNNNDNNNNNNNKSESLFNSINKIKNYNNNIDTTTTTTTTTTTNTTITNKKKNKLISKEDEEILKNKKKQFESAISNEAKPLFNRIIKFKEAEIQDDSNNQLKLKYKPINNINAINGGNSAAAKKLLDAKKKKQEQEEEDDNILAQPKKVIFSPEQLAQLMGWKNVTRIGAGLVNVGNTCFMNSVLQCLTYSVPLANFMLSREHSKSCTATGFCIFCSLETHIITSHKQAGGNKAITPREIASNIKKIAPTFRIGRQEDSHEFIRFVIESLQKVCLSKFPKGSVSHRDAMTTVIGSLFGGYLRSQVKCSVCQYESNTFDPFMDLCVDINQADSLAKGLQNFVKSEVLDGSNKYKCSKCKKLVKAHKRLQIHIAPPLLTCQIKRFSFLGSFGGKINRPIQFDQTLNLSPYMTQTTNNHTIYDLYAVLVHLGGSSSSGHYFCYVKGSNGIWYNMDDSMVSQVSLNTVLSSKAYMLFYSKRNVETSINSNTIISSTGSNTNKNISGNKRKIDENENENNNNDDGEKNQKQEIKKQKVSNTTTTTTTTTTSPKLLSTSTSPLVKGSSPLLKSTDENNNKKQKITTTTTTNTTSPKIESKKSSPPMKSISLSNDEEILNRQTSKNDHSDNEEEKESDDDDTYSESSLSGPSSESDNGGVSPTLQSSVLSSKPSSKSVVENIHNKTKKEKKEEKKKLESLLSTSSSSKVLNWEEVRYAEEDTYEDKKKLKSINNAKQLKENAKIKQDSQFHFNVAKWDDEDITIDQEAQKELLKDEQILDIKHEKDEHNKHYDLGRVKKVKVKKSLNANETNQFNVLSKKYKEQKENQLKFGDNYGLKNNNNNNNNNKKNNTNGKFGGPRKKPNGGNNGNRPKKFL